MVKQGPLKNLKIFEACWDFDENEIILVVRHFDGFPAAVQKRLLRQRTFHSNYVAFRRCGSHTSESQSIHSRK
jgi:hypothetical protein